jgi:hypothetical protein
MREKSVSSILCRLFFLAIPLSLAAAACSGATQPGKATPTSSPSPSPVTPATTLTASQCKTTEWSLDFTRSGGLAGKVATLHMTSSGTVIATQPDQRLILPTEVAPASLVQVAQLLEAACPFFSSPSPKPCPDCFTYALQIQMNGSSYSARATDVDLAGLGPLIQSLSTILDQSLSGRP